MQKSRISTMVISLFTSVTIIVVTVIMFAAGMDIPYASQGKYFESIQGIAAIIFGVSGAWLAITYPKAMTSADKARNSTPEERKAAILDAGDDTEVLLGFIHTMMVSILIISVSLAVPFIKEGLSQWNWALTHSEYFRGGLYSLLWLLAFVQLSLLYITLRTTNSALRELKRHIAEAAVKADRDDNKDL
jgi:hypothetical protein